MVIFGSHKMSKRCANVNSAKTENVMPEEVFNFYTSKFLFSPSGSRFTPDFYTSGNETECGEPITSLEMTTFTFTHTVFDYNVSV